MGQLAPDLEEGENSTAAASPTVPRNSARSTLASRLAAG